MVFLYLLIKKIEMCESLSIRTIFIKKKKLHVQFLTFYLLFLIFYQYCLLFDIKCKWSISIFLNKDKNMILIITRYKKNLYAKINLR